MGSLTPTLPVIDLSLKDFNKGTNLWASTCKEVRRVLEDYRLFEAVFNKVLPKLHAGFCDAVEELFDLPVETKRRFTSEDPLYGYSGGLSHAPLRESMSIKDPMVFEQTQGFTDLMWPQGNEIFLDAIYSYSKLVSELDQMVFDDLGVEKYYEPIVNSTTYVSPIIRYKDPKLNENNVGVRAHVDMSFTTILHQNQVNGLQVQTQDGEWIVVKPTSFSSFIVMAGFAFKVWSNGRIYPPLHQVIIHGNKVRYSLVLFSYNTGIIQTPKELVDEEHPLAFKPFNHLEGAMYYYTHKGSLPEVTL